MSPKHTASSKRIARKDPKTTVRGISLAELAAGKEASSRKFGKAIATTEKYEQRLQQGRKWLKELMEAEAESELPPGCPSQGDLHSWAAGDLRQAFDKAPTRASPWVLALFIASKCFGEDARGPATAWQIYSAFKRMWDQGCVSVHFSNELPLTHRM